MGAIVALYYVGSIFVAVVIVIVMLVALALTCNNAFDDDPSIRGSRWPR